MTSFADREPSRCLPKEERWRRRSLFGSDVSAGTYSSENFWCTSSGFRSFEETRQHVKNIELAFEQLGEEPSAEQCPGIDGIKMEHDDFVSKESPSQDVLDSFLTGAGSRTEHYKIAAYEGLVTMAEAMGETDVVELLTQNLEQEKVALEKLQTIGKRLAQDCAKQQTRA